MKLKHTFIGLAVGALLAGPIAFADEGDPKISKSYAETTNVSLTNSVGVAIDKRVFVDKRAAIVVRGDIDVPASAIAVVDDKQITNDNEVDNERSLNDATVEGSAGSGASGNVNINITAGDNNQQSNSTALTAVDAVEVGLLPIPIPGLTRDVGGMADAEIFVNQDTTRNKTWNHGNTNVARLDGAALSLATGNIGVNISAGNYLLQKNDLASAMAKNGVASEATVAILQQTSNNWTRNAPDRVRDDPNMASIGGFALSGAAGNIGVNVAAGTNNLQSNSTALAVNN